MKSLLKQVIFPAIAFCLSVIILFYSFFWITVGTMPVYVNSIGDINYTEKIIGQYLVRESANRDDNLIIFGSSELRTTDISTHPSNFFAGKRAGFQVNLVGRGSCQSLVHAISIAASGDSLTGKKVVIITSPQSFVPGGIAPDLFMANFSEQQYLALLADNELSPEVKRYISARVAGLQESYQSTKSSGETNVAIAYKAEHYANPSPLSSARNAALAPYYSFTRYLLNLKDMASSAQLLESAKDTVLSNKPFDIDWSTEQQLALSEAERMTTNNDFGMENDYYTTYIGTRLSRQENQDLSLDYSTSKEYDDLRILFEICNQKGIEPLFVHVPLHGQWSDYTGFSVKRRQQYYDNVRSISAEYGIQLLDLTENEYEPYFLCDVMHLGWKGWLRVDEALIEYYYNL